MNLNSQRTPGDSRTRIRCDDLNLIRESATFAEPVLDQHKLNGIISEIPNRFNSVPLNPGRLTATSIGRTRCEPQKSKHCENLELFARLIQKLSQKLAIAASATAWSRTCEISFGNRSSRGNQSKARKKNVCTCSR